MEIRSKPLSKKEDEILVRERDGGVNMNLYKQILSLQVLTDKTKCFLKKPILTYDLLCQKYILEKCSMKEIANQFGYAKSTVMKALKEHKIQTREPHKNHSQSSYLIYGKKQMRKKLVNYKEEQIVIKTILQMSKQGLSLKQIGDNLQALEIPTKNQGRKWHPQVIKRIIERNEKT
jgi:hypothetical protein